MRTKFQLTPIKWLRLGFLLIAFSSLSTNPSFSQSVWLGGATAADTLASVGSHWSTGVPPNPISDVIIPDGARPLHIDVSMTWAKTTFLAGSLPTRMTIGSGVTCGNSGIVTFESATARREILVAGQFSAVSDVVGGANANGNLISVILNGKATLQSDVSGCILDMTGNASADLWESFTNGTVNVSPTTTVEFSATSSQTVPAGTYGNIKFSFGGQKTLAGPISIAGTADFSLGLVNNSPASIIFFDASLGGSPTVTNAGIQSYATGPVRWSTISGIGTFTFPTGKQGAGYHPVTIDPLGAGDYTVEYIRSSATALGPITAPGIVAVSNCEYWNVTRNSGADGDLTLTWGPGSACGSIYITDPSSIRAVHFNGTSWDLSGGTAGTGTPASGSITWPIVAVFSPFTIGTVSDLNPLPVALTEFSASRCGNYICLSWKTASENNCDRFEIERSADGTQFISIGSVPGNGTTTDPHNYTFRDEHPLTGKNYYRLKQVDIDDRFAYSSIIGVKNAIISVFSASITPNPAISVMNLAIEGVKENENLVFELMNASGMIVFREKILTTGTSMVKSLPRPAVNAGLYFYKVTRTANNEMFMGKLVLQ